MTHRDFCYWLQGYFEIQGVGTEQDMEGIHPEQARIIREHLQLVFRKETNIQVEYSRPEEEFNLPPFTTSC